MNEKRTIIGIIVGLALFLSACSAPVQPAPQSQLVEPEKVLPSATPEALKDIVVDDVRVEFGVGSPALVKVMIAGTWPGLCSQLAEIKQVTGERSFDIRVSALPDSPACREDLLGLPFGIDIPLNMVERPAGTYTVTVNGVKTTFDWLAVADVSSPENRYQFEGVSFAANPDLTGAPNGIRIAEYSGANDGPYWAILPEYTRIALEGYPLTQNALKPVIAVYPVADYRRLSEPAGQELDQLANLLASRQAEARQMPFLPVMNAGQVYHSNVRYLDFQNGSGVRYLTVLAQYPAPVNNEDLFYTFQGLTSDGRYFVSVILPVNHPSLPASPAALSTSDMEQISKDPSYYPGMNASLSAMPDESFTPDLAKLDALVTSLLIQQ